MLLSSAIMCTAMTHCKSWQKKILHGNLPGLHIIRFGEYSNNSVIAKYERVSCKCRPDFRLDMTLFNKKVELRYIIIYETKYKLICNQFDAYHTGVPIFIGNGRKTNFNEFTQKWAEVNLMKNTASEPVQNPAENIKLEEKIAQFAFD